MIVKCIVSSIASRGYTNQQKKEFYVKFEPLLRCEFTIVLVQYPYTHTSVTGCPAYTRTHTQTHTRTRGCLFSLLATTTISRAPASSRVRQMHVLCSFLILPRSFFCVRVCWVQGKAKSKRQEREPPSNRHKYLNKLRKKKRSGEAEEFLCCRWMLTNLS